MKILCGLGNPGREYEQNRHNIGFMVLEALATRWKLSFSSRKFDAELAQGSFAGEKLLLLKPQTFMNLSGTALGGAARFYKVEPADVLVLHDELRVERVAPAHCTSELGFAVFLERFKDHFDAAGLGVVISLP